MTTALGLRNHRLLLRRFVNESTCNRSERAPTRDPHASSRPPAGRRDATDNLDRPRSSDIRVSPRTRAVNPRCLTPRTRRTTVNREGDAAARRNPWVQGQPADAAPARSRVQRVGLRNRADERRSQRSRQWWASTPRRPARRARRQAWRWRVPDSKNSNWRPPSGVWTRNTLVLARAPIFARARS